MNAWYQYTLSMKVPKNLPNWYQNCNISHILIRGGYYKIQPNDSLGQYHPNNKLLLRLFGLGMEFLA